jgi:hypothetical protein
MGNLCGKESGGDNFTGPGRTVSSAPGPTSASVPANAQSPKPKVKIGGPPRTLGGSSGSAVGSEASSGDAASKAREAAVVSCFAFIYAQTLSPDSSMLRSR